MSQRSRGAQVVSLERVASVAFIRRHLLLLGTSSWLAGCVVASPTGLAAYASCAAGDVCRAGTDCLRANTTTNTMGLGGSFCSRTCAVSSDCPADATGAPVTCVSAAGAAMCYRTCVAGAACPAGSTCGGPAGMPRFCVPDAPGASTCGGAGQTCCASGTVCATGLTCRSSTNTCGVPPYDGCAAASLGQACLSGTSSSGAPIEITCQQPAITNRGPNGFCTTSCSGPGAPCPAGPIAGGTANCYVPQGASTGQCFVECTGGTACPVSTVCVPVPTAAGASVQLCVPPTA